MKSGINPYGLSFVRQTDATRVSSSIKTHTNYLIFDFEENGKKFCFDSHYKANHFASVILTNIECAKKKKPKKILIFNKNYY